MHDVRYGVELSLQRRMSRGHLAIGTCPEDLAGQFGGPFRSSRQFLRQVTISVECGDGQDRRRENELIALLLARPPLAVSHSSGFTVPEQAVSGTRGAEESLVAVRDSAAPRIIPYRETWQDKPKVILSIGLG